MNSVLFGKLYQLNPMAQEGLQQRVTSGLCRNERDRQDLRHVTAMHLFPATINYIAERYPEVEREQLIGRRTPYAILLGLPRTKRDIEQLPITVPSGIIVGDEAEQIVREGRTKRIPVNLSVRALMRFTPGAPSSGYYQMLKAAASEADVLARIPEDRRVWVG